METNAIASVSAAAAVSEITISGLRPHTSESAPAMRMENDSMPVERESERLLVAGLTWNSWVKTGISGCTHQSSVNVENPAANIARLVR